MAGKLLQTCYANRRWFFIKNSFMWEYYFKNLLWKIYLTSRLISYSIAILQRWKIWRFPFDYWKDTFLFSISTKFPMNAMNRAFVISKKMLREERVSECYASIALVNLKSTKILTINPPPPFVYHRKF